MFDDLHSNTPVTDVQLLRDRLQQYPLRFAWIDGKIERVCQEEDDHVFAVNVKRGILSSLQNTMRSFDMPDVIQDVSDVIVIISTPPKETCMAQLIKTRERLLLAKC